MSREKSTVLSSAFKDMDTNAESGATSHFFCSASAFVPNTLLSIYAKCIEFAVNTTISATQQGHVLLPLFEGTFWLNDVLLVRDLGYNFVSVGRKFDKGIQSLFGANEVRLTQEEGFAIVCVHWDLRSTLYPLALPIEHTNQKRLLSAKNIYVTKLSRRDIAHMNPRDLPTVHEKIDGVPKIKQMEEVCRSCQLGKALRLPFLGEFKRAKRVGGIVHSGMIDALLPSFPSMGLCIYRSPVSICTARLHVA